VAWDDFDTGDASGITGDKPLDEFGLALERIAAAYVDRFERKPSVAELLHAFETVLGADPASYVSDPEIASGKFRLAIGL
jgi:hypothetical protein